MKFVYACVCTLVMGLSAMNVDGQSVVQVESKLGIGSGVCVEIDGSKFIATCAHVTGTSEENNEIRILPRASLSKISDGSYAFGCDWSLVEYDHDDAVPVKIAESDTVPAFFVGYDSRGLVMYPVYVAQGVSIGGVEPYLPAPVPGNSGGAILNKSFELVGIVTLRFGDTMEYGGYQPISNWTNRVNAGTVKVRKRAFLQSRPERERIPAKFASLFRNFRRETLANLEPNGNEPLPDEEPDAVETLPGITDEERQAIVDEYGSGN